MARWHLLLVGRLANHETDYHRHVLFREREHAGKVVPVYLGEKQAIAQASFARIETTKGSILFDKDGARRRSPTKRLAGSRIVLGFRSNQAERDEMIEKLKAFIAPDGVDYIVNGEPVQRPTEHKRFEAHTLQTVDLIDGVLKERYRNTEVRLYHPNGDGAWLFELGIPVLRIDCKYSADVQQKIPLAMDRESVRDSYLRDLFCQILNCTIDELRSEEASEAWVRLGAQDFQIDADTTKKLLTKRYGDKVAVFTPGDPRANDEAIANGYKVVTGSELSAEEWDRVRDAGAMPTTTALFGLNPGNATQVKPTPEMQRVATLARRIAKKVHDYDLTVQFIDLPNSAGAAWYGGGTLKFVVNILGTNWFRDPTAKHVIDLIIHELGHYHGTHTERAYLDSLTDIGARLVRVALEDKSFFDV